MANEAAKRYDESSGHGGVIQDYTIADTEGIEKGTIMQLSGSADRTIVSNFSLRAPVAGIAAREKVANDGRTQLSVYKKGYFDMLASGSIPYGEPVCAAGHDNYIIASTGLNSGSQILGYAEETASDDETILVRVDL